MINKTTVFGQSGQQDETKKNSASYAEGMTPGTVAYAEDVNTFGNMMDAELMSVCKEVANVITEDGTVLDPLAQNQLVGKLNTKFASVTALTGVLYDGSTTPTATQNGNSIAFSAFDVVFNTKGYYGSAKIDFTKVSFAEQTIAANASMANGVYYVYATSAGSIALQQTPILGQDSATKCMLGSVFVISGAFQAGSWKYQPWLRISSVEMRESPTAQTKGGYITPASTTTLNSGNIEIKDEGINFDQNPQLPDIVSFVSQSPMQYKFLYPGYDSSAQAETTLDTHHVYNLTSGSWDLLDETFDEKYMVLVPCVTPAGQRLIIPAMSYKSGTEYTSLFDDIDAATAAIYSLPYTDPSTDKTRLRAIYLGFSMVVKVGYTDLQDNTQFSIVGMVPQALSGFTTAGGQTGGASGQYIPMPEKLWDSSYSSITALNNCSNVIAGNASAVSVGLPTTIQGIINQFQVKYTHSSSKGGLAFPASLRWWGETPTWAENTVYLFIIELVDGQWYGGFLSYLAS